MTRLQKQISLPSEYWQAIESNIDNRLVRSRGDALIGILEKVYPHLTKVVLTVQPTENKSKQPQTKGNSKVQIEHTNKAKQPEIHLCSCGHPESYHSSDGCLGDGGLCECKQFTVEQGAPG
jgi:hypothetical protein